MQQIVKDRVQDLEAYAFRTNNALQTIMLQVNKVTTLVKKHSQSNRTVETRLEQIEKQQALIIEKQAQQDEKLNHMASQLNTIEKLLMRLVTQAGA